MSDKHKYFEPRMHKQALQAECCRLHDQRNQLREALEDLLADHGDLRYYVTYCADDPSLPKPNIKWSIESGRQARAALKATEE